MGPQNLDGQDVELPPVLIGSLGKDPKKKTILVYVRLPPCTVDDSLTDRPSPSCRVTMTSSRYALRDDTSMSGGMLTQIRSQALLSDGWKYEPFQFTHDKETNRLYGRGSSDDKGPILGWCVTRLPRHIRQER